MYNDYEWCAKGIAPQKQALQAMPVGLIDRWIPFFEKKECVVIEDLEKLKDSASEEYRILNGQKIKSIVVAPLEQDRELIGYLGVDNPPPERITNIGPLLQTLSYFLMLARQHSESQQQLTHLSYFDVLTGFYNRNRYIEDTQELNHGRPHWESYIWM
ncbi:MAG: GAF domain-containing protein [[Clostridium] scindens]